MAAQKQREDSPDDYEVVEVNQGDPADAVISVRLTPDEMDLLTSLAEASGQTLTGTLRRGLHCLGDIGAQSSSLP